MSIRATHAPEGAKGMPKGPEPVRYNTSYPWPGITTGNDARCQCTWAWHNGKMRLKYVNAMCLTPGHRTVADG